jgi:hypothetical protein
MRSVKPGDLVRIVIFRGHFLLPRDQLTGIILLVRHADDDAVHWVAGERTAVSGEYADVLVNGTVMVDIPTRWMGVISEAG